MSYVLARDIGCSFQDSPWEYYDQGVNTLFRNPQTPSVIGGKVSNSSVNATSDVGQSFFAYQTYRGGWHNAQDHEYHRMHSTNYPSNFLPCCWSPGTHNNSNGVQSFYNLGQIFLNNAFTFTFLDWDPRDLAFELVDRNAPESVETPTFVNPAAWPKRVRLVHNLLRGSKDSKYGRMTAHVLQQARAANDGLGVCRKALLYICGELARNLKNNEKWLNSELYHFWSHYAKTRGIPICPVNDVSFGGCCMSPLTPRMGAPGYCQS